MAEPDHQAAVTTRTNRTARRLVSGERPRRAVDASGSCGDHRHLHGRLGEPLGRVGGQSGFTSSREDKKKEQVSPPQEKEDLAEASRAQGKPSHRLPIWRRTNSPGGRLVGVRSLIWQRANKEDKSREKSGRGSARQLVALLDRAQFGSSAAESRAQRALDELGQVLVD